ncbi:MAG: HIRAN domain-containing protein [Oscillospiraceae bacterium]|nr:HIRAN domain-containing protein [Oscillospiraceae bacterium]MBQ6243226.1 HIRAN domain-containing protein [Bacteroidales bacterium]
MFLLLVIVIAACVLAATFLKKSSDDQRALENHQRDHEGTEALYAKIERDIAIQQCDTCDFLNDINKKEFEAWEKRFCTEDNPGYRIAGINHQGLTPKYIGSFKGLLKAEDWNAFDRNAVAIYWNKKKVGYIPKESSADVFAMLGNGNRQCYGCIYRWYKINESGDQEELLAGKIVLI